MKKQQQQLFDTEPYENYTTKDKAKWGIKFREYCEDKYNKECEKTGIFTCGNMEICCLCKQSYGNGCVDCVVTIRKILNNNNIDINFKNYDEKYFEELINQSEELVKYLKNMR